VLLGWGGERRPALVKVGRTHQLLVIGPPIKRETLQGNAFSKAETLPNITTTLRVARPLFKTFYEVRSQDFPLKFR